MQFWQCSISLQFLQIITAKDFAFGSLQNLHLLTSADCSVSLHAIFHCNSKCIAVIPLQFHCNFPAIVCSVVCSVFSKNVATNTTIVGSKFKLSNLLHEKQMFNFELSQFLCQLRQKFIHSGLFRKSLLRVPVQHNLGFSGFQILIFKRFTKQSMKYL